MQELPIGEVPRKPRQSNSKSATNPFDPTAEKDKQMGALTVRKRARGSMTSIAALMSEQHYEVQCAGHRSRMSSIKHIAYTHVLF
jgi:hypothetical protein